MRSVPSIAAAAALGVDVAACGSQLDPDPVARVSRGAVGGAGAGSCGRRKSQAGSTDKAITIANVADISGLGNGAMPRCFLSQYPDATQHAALLHINAGAAAVDADMVRTADDCAGRNVDHFQGIDVSEFTDAPYVRQLKDKGIRLVTYIGPDQNTVKPLGGRLTRAWLGGVLGTMKNWTGDGPHVPQQVGRKTTANRGSVFQLNDGEWRQVSPGGVQCGPLPDGN